MAETSLVIGALSVFVAIIGGGARLVHLGEIPVIHSVVRQIMLGGFGVILIGIGVSSGNGNNPELPITPTEASLSPTDTPTLTPTSTPSPTDTPTLTPTSTPSPTDTPTLTPTSTPSPTDTPTLTPTSTPSPTDTPTLTPTSTPNATATPTLAPWSVQFEPEINGEDITVSSVALSGRCQPGDVFYLVMEESNYSGQTITKRFWIQRLVECGTYATTWGPVQAFTCTSGGDYQIHLWAGKGGPLRVYETTFESYLQAWYSGWFYTRRTLDYAAWYETTIGVGPPLPVPPHDSLADSPPYNFVWDGISSLHPSCGG